MLHINNLELLAIFKVLKAFEPLVTSNIAQITTDNTHSFPFLYLTIQIWELCLEHHIFLMAVYTATHDNMVTDKLSCLQTQIHEWSLDHTVYHNICNHWGSPDVNMFATHSNTKCDKFYSKAGIG